MIVFAITIQMIIRSIHQRLSVRKGVLRNFTKLTGKRLCQVVFFNKVAGPVLKLHFDKISGLKTYIFI